MYPPPSEGDLRMLQQLRDQRRLKREAGQSDEDERDAEEVAGFLSAVVDTPFKPPHSDTTTAARVADGGRLTDTKENTDPIARPRQQYRKSGSRRKRGLSEVEESLNNTNKAARTRKDSTASKSRAGESDDDDADSFHSILARHSSDRTAFNTFKSSISRRLFDGLADFVNTPSDDEGDPFIHSNLSGPAPNDEVPESTVEAPMRLASEPLDGELDEAPPVAEDTNSCTLTDALTDSVRKTLTKFVNESLDDDVQWTPFEPQFESSKYEGFRIVRLPPSNTEDVGQGESDTDGPSGTTSSASERISASTAATTPSILRRRNAPPTPLSERKRVRFLKKNIRETCSTAGDSPSLIISARPSSSSQQTSAPASSNLPTSTSSSAPMTRATLRRAQQARQARIEVLKSSKFCKILDEYTVRCQLCKVNIGLGVDQVYDTGTWKKHEADGEHREMEREREEKRAERRRVKGKERAT